MKKVFTLLFMCLPLCAFAQNLGVKFGSFESTSRKAIILYTKDAHGFYQKTENVSLDEVKNIQKIYAYDKKTQNLFVETNNGNCIVMLKDTYAKIYKKNKNIPQLKGTNLENAINQVSTQLDAKFLNLNEKRRVFIQDSIAKAKADSIAKAKEDSIQNAAKQKEYARYRRTHNYHDVPTSNIALTCKICNQTIKEDELYVIGIVKDTIVYITYGGGDLDQYYTIVHKSHIPLMLAKDPKFSQHVLAFKDSLEQDETFLNETLLNYYNAKYRLEYYQDIEKKAPYGYFESWSWNNKYSFVTFDFRYINTNKKTIKYIDVYWKIKNDVNDVRCSGHFKGTGPLAYDESASWSWDYSSYYAAGDATHMNITKVILTYMDGTQKVLTGNQIKFK